MGNVKSRYCFICGNKLPRKHVGDICGKCHSNIEQKEKISDEMKKCIDCIWGISCANKILCPFPDGACMKEK